MTKKELENRVKELEEQRDHFKKVAKNFLSAHNDSNKFRVQLFYRLLEAIDGITDLKPIIEQCYDEAVEAVRKLPWEE